MPEGGDEPGGWKQAPGLGLRLIDVALGYYRQPLRYPQFRDPRRSLPAGFSRLIPAFGRALTPRHLEDTASSLGVAPREVLDAARFFVRQVLLVPGAGPWRMFGCESEASLARLHEHYQLLIRLFHPDRQARLTELDEEQAARLNQVYQALRRKGVGVEPALEVEQNKPWIPDEGGEALRAFLTPLPAQALTFITARHPGPPPRAAKTGSGWRPVRRFAPMALVLLALGGGGWVLTGSLPSLRSSGFEMAMAVVPPGGELRGPSQPVASPLVPRVDVTELARHAEEARQADEARRTEEARLAELVRKAEEARQAEEARRAEEARLAELARQAEEVRQADEAKRAEEARLAELARKAEEVRQADEARRAEEARLAELARKAEEVRQAEEARRAEEARLAELARQAEEVRQADEARRAEEARLAELARKAEEVRQADEARRAEEARLAELATQAEVRREERLARAPSEAGTSASASVVSRPSPDAFIDRLTKAYQAGHLEGLVGLFTPDAVTTEGRGLAFIRDDYARLFASTQRRELAIERLQWRPRKDGSQLGTGIFRVRTLPEPGQGWREHQGKIRFILIPWRDTWRIAKMEYG